MIELLDQVRVIEDLTAYNQLLETLNNLKQPFVLSFLNQHGFNLAWSNNDLRIALLKSDCILRDGVGLELALRALDRKSGLNCNGTDMIPRILQGMSGRTAAIFGTKDPWLSGACDYIQAEGIQVVSKLNGFENWSVYLSAIVSSRPEIIILGMGMPQQEELSVALAQNCDHACLIINGGAILDFMGSRFARAPKWIRRMRLEWLFRLINEPARLFGRYASGGVMFLARVSKLILHIRTSSISNRPSD
ncbi:WecB/TagA/CpsF family glycosyltransferase [Methylobacterium sp. GC_Met_2]|uniref:WecB/TagA/CpsF family glycosyltransferase n=1 Tax=Methylobacterium sp. GC_Met_2 TaxID=2937376 RepID=UPI00226B0A40|nr:WecB/TagA/CpsF family glycosyltransferase [Methylobacterium sp. GC_Met_2]